ncbi:MAG: hypothetical protein A4E55_01909 [Pelotomaculum sp. PtaU1.Bin035]|nr:MAG: hypothetical protein A4E55_01909 [Pelotomaculum sp. PtaU1.Bin035]
MENTRLLDERLRKIIGNVSERTGREIKKSLLLDFEGSINTAMEKHSHKEIIRMLALLKSAVEKI